MFDEPFDEPPPLQRGDKLFINNETRLQLDTTEDYVYYGLKKRSSFFGYALAYYRAADRLVKTFNSFPDIFNDTLEIPIVFLYRHYVELTLKDLVSDGNTKFGNPRIDFSYGHKIDLWWKELKPLLLRLFALEKSSEEIEAVEACLLEFSNVDDLSEAFRYPVHKKSKKPFLKNNPHLQSLEYIDVHHLAEKMASIYQFFLVCSIKFAME